MTQRPDNPWARFRKERSLTMASSGTCQRQRRKAGTNGLGGDLLRLTDGQAQRPKPSRDLDPTFATAVIGGVARLVTGGLRPDLLSGRKAQSKSRWPSIRTSF